MAIHQQKRENLLLEATAYPRRILLQTCGLTFRGEPITALFAGLRASGGWSLYFDESPVIQFNPQGLVRRLFLSSQKFAANGGRLELLQQQSLGGRVQISRELLSEQKQTETLTELSRLIEATRSMLRNGQSAAGGVSLSAFAAARVPIDDCSLERELLEFLDQLHERGFPLGVALA